MRSQEIKRRSSISPSRTSGRGGRRNASAYGAYIEGNTVRKPEPLRKPVPGKRPAKTAKQNDERKVRIARNREKALAMDIPYLIMLTAAVLATLYICYGYLCLHSSISAKMDRVEELETRLETLRTENDALESSISTSIDLNYVYSVAVNKLGMVRAGKDNVISFDKTESEYVRQYEDIPQ